MQDVGTLTFGGRRNTVEIDDRTLAHLQTAIVSKLRRGESFQFTWERDVYQGSGRTSVWVHSTTPVRFRFDDTARISANPRWIESLLQRANAGELTLVPEPPAAVAPVP